MKIQLSPLLRAVLAASALVFAGPALASTPAVPYCFTDNYGYKWKLTDLAGGTATGLFFQGIVIRTDGIAKDARASYLVSTNSLNFFAEKGASTAFSYNMAWTGAGANGIWVNDINNVGNVTVTLVTCTAEFNDTRL